MGQITIEFNLNNATIKQGALWQNARKSKYVFAYLGANYKVTNTSITDTAEGPIGLIGAEETDEPETNSESAKIINHIKDSARLISNVQDNLTYGSDHWHTLESADDELHEALTLLGD